VTDCSVVAPIDHRSSCSNVGASTPRRQWLFVICQFCTARSDVGTELFRKCDYGAASAYRQHVLCIPVQKGHPPRPWSVICIDGGIYVVAAPSIGTLVAQQWSSAVDDGPW